MVIRCEVAEGCRIKTFSKRNHKLHAKRAAGFGNHSEKLWLNIARGPQGRIDERPAIEMIPGKIHVRPRGRANPWAGVEEIGRTELALEIKTSWEL